MPGLTILRVVSNSEIERTERERMDAELQARQNSDLITGLSAHLKTCWDAARIAKDPINDVMLRALRQRNGEYEADKLQAIRVQGGSEVYMMLTEVKCRAAESWLRDILLDTGSPPWDLQPTPIPDLSPEQSEEVQTAFAEQVMEIIQSTGQAPNKTQMLELREMVSQDYRFKVLQAAQARVDRMKIKIDDQFLQGGWADAFNEFLTDLVTFPCAFVKGPIVRRQRHLGWTKGPGGATIVEASERLAPEFERVSPFNIYPEPGITRINDGYIFEYHRLSRSALADLIGVPGYDDQAIRKVLDEGPGQTWVSEPTEMQREEE